MERLKKRLDILKTHLKKCEPRYATDTKAQMDLPVQEDSSGSSDQSTSKCGHYGLYLLSLVAEVHTSIGDHEISALKAETSKSVSPQNDNTRLLEKDHCRQSSSEHEELETLDLSTKDDSPHPPEDGKRQRGVDKRQKVGTEGSWSSYASTNAHSTMEQLRWNKKDGFGCLAKDVITLQNYLRNIEDQSKAELKKSVSIEAYRRLCESLLAQMIIFNRTREGAQLLTLETYQKAESVLVNKDVYDTLSPVEKQMSHRLTQIVTRGKVGRGVPILVLERTKASLDFLITKRNDVGVLKCNPYLFAKIGTRTHIRGWNCLRKHAELSKTSNPKLLRWIKLKTHVATLCQLFNLDHHELEQVARFAGHDLQVYTEHYRQTDKTFQVAKIGKLLFLTEQEEVSLKERRLKTMNNNVVFGVSTRSRSSKEGQTSDAKRPLKDGDLQHLSTTRRQKKTATQSRQHENAGSERDVDEEEQPQTPERPVDWSDDEGGGREQHSVIRKPTASRQKKRAATEHNDYDADKESEDDVEEHHQTTRRCRAKRQKTVTEHDDWGDDETGGTEQLRMNTRPPTKRQKKTSTKQKHDADSDEEEQITTAIKSSAKKGKKTATERGKTGAKLQVRRPWTYREKKAVQRRMAKFIALRKVPGKKDCLQCIRKVSPALHTRTWKDVKYFVCNEVIKRRLDFKDEQ